MTYSFSLKHKKSNLILISVFFTIMLVIFLITPTPDLQLNINNNIGVLLQALSTSAGNPFFILSSAILASLSLLLRLPFRKLLILYIQFALILGLSFILKSTLKFVTEVPRPFTTELVKLGVVDSTEQFYQLTEHQKEQVVLQLSSDISAYRITSWQGEKNYSFPSGHSIFVAICVVFWGGVFLREKRYLITASLLIWASGVAFSRYWLGMHWPSDILMSILCAAGLMLLIPEIKHHNY